MRSPLPLSLAISAAVLAATVSAGNLQAQSLERDIERLVESIVGRSERLAYQIERQALMLADRVTTRVEGRRGKTSDSKYDDFYGAVQQSRMDTTFSFSPRGTIDLNSGSGDIIITGSDRSDVQVRAYSERGTLRLDASSSRMTLEVRSERGNSRNGRYGDTRLELLVPRGTRVVARSSSGDVRVTNVTGGVEVNSSSGDLVLEDCDRVHASVISGEVRVRGAGEIDASSVSGDVVAERVSGDVRLSTTSGDVVATQSTARFAHLSSNSGDVTYDGTVDPTGRYEFETHSGTVEVTLPRSTSANITIATYSGDIESDFPLVLQPGDRAFSRPRRLEFSIGSGGPRILAESFSGDVEIRRK